LEAIKVLRQMWEHQFINEDGKVRWRPGKELAQPVSDSIHHTIPRQVIAWLNEIPHAKTRPSHFARLVVNYLPSEQGLPSNTSTCPQM
jgi:hypothetical protein